MARLYVSVKKDKVVVSRAQPQPVRGIAPVKEGATRDEKLHAVRVATESALDRVEQ